MRKKLKKRIIEAFGLNGLPRDERVRLARHIVRDDKEKQRLCNEIMGLSFRDIEKVMASIINEKKFSRNEEEEELMELAPEKFNSAPIRPPSLKEREEQEVFRPKSSSSQYRNPTREEVQWLLEQSKKPVENPDPPPPRKDYDTYTMEEVAALLRGDYNPEHFKHLRKKPNRYD